MGRWDRQQEISSESMSRSEVQTVEKGRNGGTKVVCGWYTEEGIHEGVAAMRSTLICSIFGLWNLRS